MKRIALAVGMIIGLLAIGLYAIEAGATTIDILDVGQTGTATPDGVIFLGDPNPTSPSTGTGVFEPFVRIQEPSKHRDGLENGFNTDANHPEINFDTKDGSSWTRSVQFGELGVIDGYYVLQLDANQTSKSTAADNQILITQMEIFIGDGLSNPEASNTGISGTGYSGTLFDGISNGDNLLGQFPVWSLNDATHDWDVLLQASICDSNGQCGSGHGDLDVFIPQSLLGIHDPTDNFVLYTEYAGANDGFEEWRFNSASSVPEPGMVALLLAGLPALGLFRKLRLR